MPTITQTVSSSQVNISWWNTDDETNYRIEVSLDGGVNWATLVILPADSTTHSAMGLSPGTQHWFRVFALNAEGDSIPSSTATATTLP